MSKMHHRRPALLGLSTGLLISIGANVFSITASADPVSNGKQAFSLCAACHRLDGKSGVGPYLNGVIGRKAGELEGFRYSRPMKSSGVVWTAEALDKYLQNPQTAMPGNRMPFSGLPDADKRADIIAYLATMK
jgi:cytochrome c